jgi:hypothetical protein
MCAPTQVVSPHSDWILDDVAPAALRRHLPAVYEALLAPVYWLYRLVGPDTTEWLAHELGLAEAGAVQSYGAGYLVVMLGSTGVPVALALGAAVRLSKARAA